MRGRSELQRQLSLFRAGDHEPGTLGRLLSLLERLGEDALAREVFAALAKSWRAVRNLEVASLIDAHGPQFAPEALARLRDGRGKIGQEIWMKHAREADDFSRGALVQCLTRGTLDEIAQRVAEVEKWAPDPRVSATLVSWLDTLPFRSIRMKPTWSKVFRVLVASEDPRVLATLKRLEGATLVIGSTMQSWLGGQIAEALAALEKRGVSLPDQDGASAALLEQLVGYEESKATPPEGARFSASAGEPFYAGVVLDMCANHSAFGAITYGAGWGFRSRVRRSLSLWGRSDALPVQQAMDAPSREIKLSQVCLSPCGERYAICTKGGAALFLKGASAPYANLVTEDQNALTHVCFASSGEVYFAEQGGQLRRYDAALKRGVCLIRWRHGTSEVFDVETLLSPCGRYLALRCGWNQVQVHELVRGAETTLLQAFQLENLSALELLWSPCGEKLLALYGSRYDNQSHHWGVEIINPRTAESHFVETPMGEGRNCYVLGSPISGGFAKDGALYLLKKDKTTKGWVRKIENLDSGSGLLQEVKLKVSVEKLCWDPAEEAWVMAGWDVKGRLTWRRFVEGKPELAKVASRMPLLATVDRFSALGDVAALVVNETAELRSGEKRKRITYNSGIGDVTVSSDASKVVVGTGNSVRVFQSSKLSAKPMLIKGAHGYPVTHVRLTPDDQRVVTFGQDRALRVWSLSEGEKISESFGHERDLLELCVHPGGELVAALEEDGKISVKSIEEGTLLKAFDLEGVRSMAWCASLRRLYLLEGDQLVQLHLLTGERTSYALEEEVSAIAAHPYYPSVLALGSIKRSVGIWRFGDKKPLCQHSLLDAPSQLGFSPCGEELLINTATANLEGSATRLRVQWKEGEKK